MKKVSAILFYKDGIGRKVPIDYFNDFASLLIQSEKNKNQLENYKEKTLYLWVEGTEFLVKDKELITDSNGNEQRIN